MPTMATMVSALVDDSNNGCDRTIRYTPAVTIVAAWISADTGVGPSIASPSQDCSGTCADLPHAASNSSSPIAVSTPSLAAGDAANTPVNEIDPNVANITNMASASPTSPTRLTTNAFLACVPTDGLWYQKPISRYDARPTPSQPT